ncbi:MAG: HD domain-containing protein [Desulfobacteraceae bacterium]|nr:MAG: HD domain-containing protein [Desulfobacteraceae bacterium]
MKIEPERFLKQIEFLIEIDKLKHILRKSKIFDGSRFENDAEHAWHLGVMALVLAEHANYSNMDIAKVIKMVLIHDLVEIDAGDVIVYDTDKRVLAHENEKNAAERLFGLLPQDQKNEFMELWQEFEARKSSESKFAAAIDRFEPILQNHLTEYYAWKKHGVTSSQLYEKNKHIQDGSKKIWEIVQQIFAEAGDRGELGNSVKTE